MQIKSDKTVIMGELPLSEGFSHDLKFPRSRIKLKSRMTDNINCFLWLKDYNKVKSFFRQLQFSVKLQTFKIK
ncbi:MAG: hypothetical protein CVU99_01190 [Firmicutes bacterium HGW-Firmicutes-4]|jgi:hypothetical protein|nr:MAG: hypothetical protein CVU99_01190 [Firmicutes bacterium HGW-Firmicutes-4]